jgi:hypothetical protein
MARKVAVSKFWSQGVFLADSPANTGRGVETTRSLPAAKWDFADQTEVDTYLVARGGAAGDFVVLDLDAAGVK